MAVAATAIRRVILAGLCLVAACDAAPPPASVEAERPARIVTLSPHLAELVFAAGAGQRLVGVSAYSDFPDEVRGLPRVGDAFLVDQEQLQLLSPDLVLAWASGTPERTIDQLRERGFRVEILRTRNLADVASALEQIGRLAGTAARASAAAERYRAGLSQLRAAHGDRDPIRVFYQISSRPIYTVNGSHYVSELIDICGGTNVFEDLGEFAPMISEEAVLAKDPEVMLTGGTNDEATAGGPFDQWLHWEDLSAVRWRNLSVIDANLLGRATPRLLLAGEAVCAALDSGRRRRAAAEV